MSNNISLALCAATLALAPVGASALSFTVTQYSDTDLATAQSDFGNLIGPNWKFSTTEAFESFSVGQIGTDATASLGTSVGDFTTLGGTGTGATAIGTSGTASDADRGLNLSVRKDDDAPNNGGRQNTSAGLGDKTYLDSNDTKGIEWMASAGGMLFDRLLFTLTDPADQGKTLTISAAGHTETYEILPRQPNGEIFNVLIGFSTAVTGATVTLEKSGLNDGFSIDNATVGAVPLPAAAWLLLGVSGALVGAKRRSARKAA